MWLSLCYKLWKYAFYHTVRRAVGFLQGCFWLVSGTYFNQWRSRRPGNYSWSAHVQTVWFRYKFDLVLEPSGPANFISTHHSFQDPSYVLSRHATLYYVTRDEAVFVETDPSVDAPHSDNGSFLRVAQFLNARRIIRMPIASFHRLADQIGAPKGEIIFISNTARCGSTLLSQIFEETNRVLSFSEPDALNAIGLYEGRMPQAELDRLVVNSVRILCKPVGRGIDGYILKTTAPTINAVPMFLRLFPKSHQLFMYREGVKVAQSLVRSAGQMPLLEITFFVTRWSEALTKKSVEAMGLSPDMFKVRVKDSMVFSVYVWAVIIDKYLKYRKQGIPIVAVKYEDLVKYPLPATKAIFKYCNLSTDLAEIAVKALDKDSQRLSPLSMQILSKFDTCELTHERKKLTDKICDQFSLPKVPEPCTLDGTITALGTMATGNGTSNWK